jgi:hypothetical protein
LEPQIHTDSHRLNSAQAKPLAIGFILMFASWCGGCSTHPPGHFITEHDARLISIARQAAVAKHYSLDGMIYFVRQNSNEWVVQAFYCPDYDGGDNPSVVTDFGWMVSVNSKEQVTGVLHDGP